MYVLTLEPKALVRVGLERFAVDWKLPLSEDPHDFAISPDGKMAAVSAGQSVRLVDLAARKIGDPLGHPVDIGAVRFLSDSSTMVAANRGERLLSIYDVASSKLIADLPIAVRPDTLCFSHDGGQLFITGEGIDGVVIVYPYNTPEVGKTVLAGHAPGAMAASDSVPVHRQPVLGRRQHPQYWYAESDRRPERGQRPRLCRCHSGRSIRARAKPQIRRCRGAAGRPDRSESL